MHAFLAIQKALTRPISSIFLVYSAWVRSDIVGPSSISSSCSSLSLTFSGRPWLPPPVGRGERERDRERGLGRRVGRGGRERGGRERGVGRGGRDRGRERG